MDRGPRSVAERTTGEAALGTAGSEGDMKHVARLRTGIGLALLVTALAVWAVPAAARPQAATLKVPAATGISGTIKDTEGGVLPGVTVTALNIASGRDITVVTDSKGQYSFDDLAPGNYRVTARLAGFSESGKSLQVVAGQRVTNDVTMSLGGLSEEITVTAAKGERATAEVNQIVTIISAADMEQTRPQGAEDAIDRAPNVRSMDNNPYRARPVFRGFANSRIMMVIDGERLNNSRYDVEQSGVTPATIDISQIESIEVVGGAASSLYGSDAVAGTINIITKTAPRPSSGKTLDLTGNFDFNSSSNFARGNFGLTFASPKVAVRFAASDFNQPSYHAGSGGYNHADEVALGQFLSNGGALVGRDIASTFTIYDFPSNGEVVNGTAKGYTYNLDASFFPSEKQMFRVKWMQNKFTNLGMPFSAPPYDTDIRNSSFSDFDKLSLRYEAREVKSWFPRLSLSIYRQEMKRPQGDSLYGILPGSSYDGGNNLTGNVSQFFPSDNTTTLNDITSWGFDVQANLQPMRSLQYTTGVQYAQDFSADNYSNTVFDPYGNVLDTTMNAKTTPDTYYKNFGWYNQAEWTPVKYAKLSAGFRVDNWRTQANPSPGFPAGNEYAIVTAALPQIVANPGDVQVSGIAGVATLASGAGSLSTNDNSVTGNAGVTFLLPGGINPYIRYATSFREPEITVRYLIRDFGDPYYSVPSLPNTSVKPETGKNVDVGVKVQRDYVQLQAGFFHNDLTNAVSTVYSPNYCIPANPAGGLLVTPWPPCVFTGEHGVLFFQRKNIPGDTIVKGFESSGEVAVAIGHQGSLNPYYEVGWEKGTVSNPTSSAIALMNAYYNRSDTPIKLTGTPSDAPYGEMPTWTGRFGTRFSNATNRWWAEWEMRWATQTTRIDPDAVFSANFPLYPYLLSYSGFSVHTIRAGYNIKGPVPLKITVIVDNITDKLYVLPFQPAPSPGRSFILGATFDFKTKFD